MIQYAAVLLLGVGVCTKVGALSCTVLCTVLYCTVLYCTVLYCTCVVGDAGQRDVGVQRPDEGEGSGHDVDLLHRARQH